jgi:hypothetical protein
VPPLDQKSFQRERKSPQVLLLDRKAVQRERKSPQVLPLDSNALQQERKAPKNGKNQQNVEKFVSRWNKVEKFYYICTCV